MIYITFDTDHMTEYGIQEFLEKTELPGESTFFCTQPYKSIVHTAFPHEVAFHPILDSTIEWAGVIKKMVYDFGIIPSGLRSHSCTYSQRFAVTLSEIGIKYISHQTPLFQKGIKPYFTPWGLWEFPIYYMDNMDFILQNVVPHHRPFNNKIISSCISDHNSVYVFDFHPIHIMLNTSRQKDYLSWFESGCPKPRPANNKRKGVRDFFMALVSEMRMHGEKSASLSSWIDNQNQNYGVAK